MLKSTESDAFAVLAAHYEQCLAKHGPCPQGMDWPNGSDLAKRFSIMLQVLPVNSETPVRLLDLGCGIGLLLDYFETVEPQRFQQIDYTGIDISAHMIACAKQRWPAYHFIQHNILESASDESPYDYLIMNGVLTEKQHLSQTQMETQALRLIETAFRLTKKALVFNVMSPCVDWRRADLFHWDLDAMMQNVTRHLTRHVTVRHDYGLYEYTVYLYHQPQYDSENIERFAWRV